MRDVPLGTTVTFRKTVSESDVYGYAGITGDFHANHVDEEAMRNSVYGGRIAHGTLVLGYTSAASTAMSAKFDGHAVSYGYDRVRFTGAVRLGDTLTVTYSLTRIEPAESMAFSDIRVLNQDNELVLVAVHILKFLAED
ncbi:MAG: MaoC/PaaZ C-terminal domain-containing protein [Nocardioides sp.]|uniref:MaoC family dehydratase n=1 Tax=Nocardioides sp. TaxID=35761 RepID=UPI0039E6997C